ncbi:helix-turn-helix domain-containing protein [Streptomyces fagopyri]|uniref:Helix-turn-helix domain-containing protein n=1 Tax=Streptomyces fagopyri TaxID=2662397 RepID=A0A5Q0L4T9_9ACTN|nr:winged helix-turn-helix domain-containing protein [Streptomyces fagopyri]QFZ72030.1 helix-turn-helix domain-containing protein [Streptomyces fagopyri]
MRDHLPSLPLNEDVLEIVAPAQFAALANPLRQRLLLALGRQPATIRQLAARLDAKKGNVAHHLKVLREAGLVHVAETRQVRGGTEQYYQRVGRHIVVAEPQVAGSAVMLAAVAQELGLSPADTHLTLRHLRLSPTKARELGEALAKLVDEAEEDAEDQPLHAVLVALCQQALPTSATSSA